MRHRTVSSVSNYKVEEKQQMMQVGAEVCKFLDAISTFPSPQKEELFVAYCLKKGSPAKMVQKLKKAA